MSSEAPLSGRRSGRAEPAPQVERMSPSVGGAVKVGGEGTGKNTTEGSAKRTAKQIGDELRVAFQKQGWI